MRPLNLRHEALDKAIIDEMTTELSAELAPLLNGYARPSSGSAASSSSAPSRGASWLLECPRGASPSWQRTRTSFAFRKRVCFTPASISWTTRPS